MERLSNDIQALRAAARQEIDAIPLDPNETLIATFSEFPALAPNPYTIGLIQNPQGKLHALLRKWDSVYDFQRWDKGIYNLDRLRILNQKQELPEATSLAIRQTLEKIAASPLPETLQNPKAIMLDGSEWRLQLNTHNLQVEYRWRAASEDIKLFSPLIDQMLALFAEAIKRNR